MDIAAVHQRSSCWCTDPTMLTAFVTFADCPGDPKVRMSLPLVRLGDKLELKLTLQRRNGGRTEELRIDGEFRVASLVIDARLGRVSQAIHVLATGVTPVWRPIKNPPPSRFPIKRLKVPPQD